MVGSIGIAPWSFLPAMALESFFVCESGISTAHETGTYVYLSRISVWRQTQPQRYQWQPHAAILKWKLNSDGQKQYLMGILLWIHILNTVYSFIHHFLSEIINCLTFNNSWAAVGNQDIGALIRSGSTTGLRTERNHVNEALSLAVNSPIFVLDWYLLLRVPGFKWSLYSQ